jgi:hypothetical protein
MTGKNRIMIFGPKDDGTYIVEFKTDTLAVSVSGSEAAVLKHFQARATGLWCRTFREELFACPRVCRSGALAPPPQQMRGFPRPRPMGIRAGFSFGEKQTFVGNPTDGPPVNYSGADGRRDGRPSIKGVRPHADNRRPGSNNRPDRLLDSSACNSVLLRNPSFSKQIDTPWR